MNIQTYPFRNISHNINLLIWNKIKIDCQKLYLFCKDFIFLGFGSPSNVCYFLFWVRYIIQYFTHA